MSTERELAEKFKEAVELKSIDVLYPYLAEGMTYEVLPSTFVVILMGGTSWTLSALFAIQGRDESRQGRMERPDDRYARCPGVC